MYTHRNIYSLFTVITCYWSVLAQYHLRMQYLLFCYVLQHCSSCIMFWSSGDPDIPRWVNIKYKPLNLRCLSIFAVRNSCIDGSESKSERFFEYLLKVVDKVVPDTELLRKLLYQKLVWPWWCVGWCDTLILSCVHGFKCIFQLYIHMKPHQLLVRMSLKKGLF